MVADGGAGGGDEAKSEGEGEGEARLRVRVQVRVSDDETALRTHRDPPPHLIDFATRLAQNRRGRTEGVAGRRVQAQGARLAHLLAARDGKRDAVIPHRAGGGKGWRGVGEGLAEGRGFGEGSWIWREWPQF